MAREDVRGSPVDLHIAVLMRALVPYRKLRHDEALFYAEQQAFVFLKLVHVHEPPVQIERLACDVGLVADIRHDPEQEELGMSRFDKSANDWVIILNSNLPAVERAFVIAHEIKHILDDGFGELLYRPVDVMSTPQRKEYVADYFATCLLMPRLWLERDWKRGVRRTGKLATQFAISAARMRLRQEALDLLEAEDKS